MEAHAESIIKERLKSFASEKTQTQTALAYSEDISDFTSAVTQYLWLAKSDQNKRND